MATFAYRILPPRPALVATITPEEGAVMGRHWEHIQALHARGVVQYVGRAENGDYGFCVIEAADEAEADRIARSDPAVAEGLMRLELHAFKVVLDRPA
jgi:uncharacterized protein YciI